MGTGTFTIHDVIVVNEGRCYRADVQVEEGRIAEINEELRVKSEEFPTAVASQSPVSSPVGNSSLFTLNSSFLLPGIIDGHVHMREPGLTHKATMESETRAAARGGVTTVLDMPNVVPQTTTLQLLQERYAMAKGKCHVNYGFYLGATNDNNENALYGWQKVTFAGKAGSFSEKNFEA